MKTNKPQKSYVPVDLKTFIINTYIDYNLFTYIHKQKKYVLFSSPDTKFGDLHRKKLLDNKMNVVYVASADYDKHLRYVERNLDGLLANDTIAEAVKVGAMHEASDIIVRDMLDQPVNQENMLRTKKFANQVVDFTTKKPTSLSRFLELVERDDQLSSHSMNVCVYSLLIARKMGIFDYRNIQKLAFGSLLHDVGMTFVPNSIMEKKEKLTSLDWTRIEKHTELGYSVLQKLSYRDKDVEDIVRYHHERLDGTGYPKMLSGKRISPLVRIVTIADIFNAINSERAYSKSFSTYDTFMKMLNECEGEIDLGILKTFIQSLQKKESIDAK